MLAAPLVAIPLFRYLIGTSTAWLSLFFVCALLTPPLPIALGDSGPHIALLVAAAGIFIGLLRLSEWRFRVDGLSICILALWSVFAFSVSLAALYSGATIAAGSLARVLLFGISIYVFLYVRDGPADLNSAQAFRMIRVLFWAATVSALFACVDFYFQFPAPAGYEQQFIWLESGVYRRAQGVFYEASTLGNLCAFFLEMIAVALFRPKEDQPFSRLSLALGGIALAAALVLSYSRASIVNLVVAAAVLLWLNRKRIRWARLLAGVAVFGAGASAILLSAFPDFRQRSVVAHLGGIPVFFRVAQCGTLRAACELADADRFSLNASVACVARSGIQDASLLGFHRNDRDRRQHLSHVAG